jgi:hypothetical protein
LNLNLLPKLGLAKRIPLASFFNHLLGSTWIKSISYALLPRHKGAKWKTIGVIRGANAKLSHHRVLVLACLMENEMSFVHHTVEQLGCIFICKDTESLNEITWGHPMIKHLEPRLMQLGWEQGRVLNWDGHKGLD